MQLHFVTVDVFTGTQFAGNPLAVVLNADSLSTAQMQAIAGEFNLSETTFALARAGESHGRAISGDKVVFEEIAGLVTITLLKDAGAIVGAQLKSPQPLSLGAEIPLDLIASAHALSIDDIETRHHLPRIASCGTPFVIAEVTGRDALARAAAQADIFHRQVAALPAVSVLLYTQVDESGLDIRARMFSPHHGIAEDPATGSANVALVGLLTHLRPERDLTLSTTIMQGFEMGRPSLLHAQAIKTAGVVAETTIGGRCVPVMAGTIEIA